MSHVPSGDNLIMIQTHLYSSFIHILSMSKKHFLFVKLRNVVFSVEAADYKHQTNCLSETDAVFLSSGHVAFLPNICVHVCLDSEH